MNAPFIELDITFEGEKRRLIAKADEPITIGRAAQCQVVINDPSIAERYARLVWNSGETLLLELIGGVDSLRSNTGLQLDGKPAIPPLPLPQEQTLTIGTASITWRKLPAEECPTIVRKDNHSESYAARLAAEVKHGRYKTSAEIGRGGMGKVLATREEPLRRNVALKVLLDSTDQENQRRFIREARITGGLEHPSIVPIHELNVDEHGRIFYTMKLARGVTLYQILHGLKARHLETLRQYRLASLLTIFQKVCDAVAFAHSQSPPIIHRDLKPGNIMVGDYGEVLVMDWGAAKRLDDNVEPGETGKSSNRGEEEILPPEQLLLTQPGAVIGTPGYMAPEQAAGRSAVMDQRADIYALGGILYSLLTLELPARLTSKDVGNFETNSNGAAPAIFHQHVAPLLSTRSARPRLEHLPGKGIPDSLVAVVLKAMSLRPEDRFQTVKQLQTDISAYQSGRATSAEAAGAWKLFKLLVTRNKILFTALGTIFVILITATGISLYQRHAALKSNEALKLTLQHASEADLEAARQRFRAGAWREGLALLGRSLTFWPENKAAANYLLSAIAFGQGDRDKLPIFGIYHDAWIKEAAFSSDGRYFATASYDRTTKVWDSATGRQVGKTLQHTAECNMPCFSADGGRLLSTDTDGVVMLSETETGQRLARPMQHRRPDLDDFQVTSAVFSSDGKQVLTGSYDHTARVWDASSGKELAQLVNPQRVAYAVWSPDESRILTSYWYGGAMLWDTKTFKPIGNPMTHSATVRTAFFTPDGNKIVTSSLDKTARIWDGHTGKPLTPPLLHPDFVWSLDISRDGKLFATACYDKKVRLWSIADGSPVGVPMEHDGPVDTVAFSPDSKRLVSASRDKTVRLWDVATCKEIGNPMRHDETVLRAIFNSEGDKILSVGWDSAAYLWDARAPRWPGEVLPIPGEVCSIEFTQNEDGLFVVTRDGKSGIWSLSKNEFVSPVIRHGDTVSLAAFHSTGKQFATAGSNGIIRFWNAETGQRIGETKLTNDTIMSLEYAVDGKSLFAAYLSGSVLQWKIPEGTQIGRAMRHSEKMDALAVSPSGNEIASGCRDDSLYLWKIGSQSAPARKIRHTNPVLAVTYSPDGRFIATGCDDHTARIWSVASGEQQGEPFYLNGRPTALRFIAGGNALLVAGAEDTDVDYYDTNTHNPLYLPLPQPTGVSHITANTNGSLVITVTNDGIARLWRIPSTSHLPPNWLPEYLRALGGLAFSPQQQLVQVSTKERLKLRQQLLSQSPEHSLWDRIMRWSFEQEHRNPVPDPEKTNQETRNPRN